MGVGISGSKSLLGDRYLWNHGSLLGVGNQVPSKGVGISGTRSLPGGAVGIPKR